MGPFSVCGSGGFSRIDTVPTKTYTEGERLPRSNHAEDVDAAQVASEHDRIFRYPLSFRPLSPSRFYLPTALDLPPSLPLPPPSLSDALLPVGNIHKLLQPQNMP